MREVARDYPSARALIVGTGVLEASLRAQCREWNLERSVQFAGFHPNLGAVLAAADLFVQPSLSESLPVSLLEAVAAGVPVIATDVGGVGELVVSGETGVLVPAGDSRALALGVSRTLASPQERAAFARNAKRRLRERFSPDVVVRCIESSYDRIVGRRRRLVPS
jgi:glycosyltransferase involved in cell wall biosynthesis